MQITIVVDSVMSEHGVWSFGDHADIPARDAGPMLNCLQPSAIAGHKKVVRTTTGKGWKAVKVKTDG